VDVKPRRRYDSRHRQAQAAQPRQDILAAATHILSGGSWQCAGPHEMVAASHRDDEMPYLAKFSRRPSTAGLKQLTRQDSGHDLRLEY
jgi:hypothetical protein